MADATRLILIPPPLPSPRIHPVRQRLIDDMTLRAFSDGTRRNYTRYIRKWVVYCKAPFGGPENVLAYLARYTHRVAIGNSRLIAFDGRSVSFKFKDYRKDGAARYGVMTLSADDFIRRFLLHVLPNGFHRIRHYGLLANNRRVENIAKARALLSAHAPAPPSAEDATDALPAEPDPCSCCGGRMILIEIFERGSAPKTWRTAPDVERRDSS